MKQITEFLKTTALGGVFVLVPVLLLYLLLTEALGLIVALATPIADLFPQGTFDEVKFLVLIALILIIGASFLIGLALRFSIGRRIGDWIGRNFLERLPVYNVLKQLTMGFVHTEDGAAFRPAVLSSPDGERELAYLIEDHGDGQATVLVPWAPTAFAGSLKILDRSRIEVLDTNLADFTRVLSQWGVGVRDLVAKSGTGGDRSERSQAG
jgi:uncharacterized membrane protein